MEMESYKILHVETVDRREVQLRLPNMEHEAFIRSMRFIKGKLTCTELVTDGSSSIRKTIGNFIVLCFSYMPCYISATKYPDIFHSLDVWHKAKRLRKALTNVDIIGFHIMRSF